MKKKFLFALPAIIAGMLATSALANDVAKIGDVGYSTFAEALSAVKDNDVIYLLDDADASSVAFTPCNGKSVIIAGQTGEETLNMGDGDKGGISNANITFLNLKMQIRHSKTDGTWYTEGMYHATKIKYENVVFDGVISTYDDVDFLNCTFTSNPQNMEYTTWNYGGTQIFKGCKFLAESAGTKSFIKLYNQGAAANVAVIDCEFTLPDPLPGGWKGSVVYSSNPAAVASAAKEYTSGNKVNGVETTNVVKYSSDGSDGVTVYETTEAMGITLPTPTVLPTNAVAKIGDVEYPTLDEAIAAVPAGTETTITLMENITMIKDKGITIAKDKNIILELNGKTLAGTSEVIQSGYSFSLITNNGTLTIQDTSSEGTGKITYTGMKDDTYKNATSNTITNYGTLTVKGGTLENLTENGMAVYTIDNNSNGVDATLNIEGGTVYAKCEAIRQFANSTTRMNTVNISAGTVEGEYGTLFIQDTSANQNHAATTTISGGTLKSNNQPICRFFASSVGARCENMTLNITGGDFNKAPVKIQYNYNYTDEDPYKADISISGGTFAVNEFVVKNNGTETSTVISAENMLAEGYELKKNSEGKYGPVKVESYVCEMNGTKYPSLAAAVAAVPADGEEVTIKMIADENILGNAGVTINAGQNIVLDLNGKTVKNLVNENKASQVITNKGTLTIKDSSDPSTGLLTNAVQEGTDPGEWWGENQKNYATNVITNCGTLIVEGGEIYETAESSISYAIDNNSSAAAAILTVNGGYIHKDSGTAVRQFCNSTTLDNTVNVNGGIIKGGYAGIWIQLPGSSGQAKKAALNVTGGTLEGQYAFYDYSYGDTFPATQYNLDGGKFDGDVFSYGANVAITDGDFKGEVAIKQTSPSTVSVSGGTFASDVYTYGDNASTGFITGGTFAAATYVDEKGQEQPCEWTKCLAEGYVLQENGNGTYGPVEAESSVCEMNGTKYPSLAAAVAAVPADGEEVTIKMIDDENILGNAGVTIEAGQNIVLDLNGKTLKNLVNENKASQVITNKGTLTITGNGTMTNELADGTIAGDWPTYNYATNLITNLGTLTIENGTFNNTQDSGITYALDNNSNGVPATATINGGVFTSAGNAAVRMFCNSTTALNSLTINGGYFEGNYYAVSVSNASGATKMGALVINNGEFESRAEEYNACVANWASNKSDNISVEINGGQFNDYVLIASNSNVSGGTFKYSSYTDPDDGTVYDMKEYLAEDCALSVNSDGTYSPIVCEGSETITYYVGSDVEVDATFAEWKEAVKSNPNTIVVVDKELEGFAMANVNVVVEDEENGNYCPYLALTDLSDFYSPVDFTATDGEYARGNTSGLNSVCMPFALSAEDVNGVIGVVYSGATNAGEVVTKVEFSEVENVDAATPCIVQSSSNAWNIDLAGREIVGSLKVDYVELPALKGSFTTNDYYKISTADNSYKISSDGTVLVQCIEGSIVFPFRACFDMGNSNASKSISISWRDNGTTDILLPVEDGTESEIFDIMGRRVSQPMKGGMYIVNGQKIVY